MKKNIEVLLGFILINIIAKPSLGYVQKFVKMGDNVKLECNVPKASPPVVAWRDHVFSYDGTIDIFTMDRDGSRRNENHPKGDHFVLNPSTLALEITNMDSNFVGNYKCDSVVGDKTHTVNYFLAVYNPMECTGSGTYVEGEEQEFSCQISFSGREPLLTMFLSNGTSLENQYDKETEIDFVAIKLKKQMTAEDDGGFLVCKAELDEITDECRIKMGVKHSTRNVILTPNSGKVNVGDKVTCTGDGNPKPHIVIHRDGGKNGEAMFKGEGSVSMEVPKDWVNQDVDIHCIAENKLARAVNGKITLKVGESVGGASTEVPGKLILVLNVFLIAIVNLILH